MEREEGRYRCNQAQMIDELETTIPRWAYNYAAWCPTWVHFLQREADAKEGEEELAAAAGEDDNSNGGKTAGESVCLTCDWCLAAAHTLLDS